MARPRNATPNFRLERNRNGYFEIRWTEGRSRSVSTGTKERAEADKFLDQWLAGRAAPKSDGPTIGAILNAYLDAKQEKASYGSLKAIANQLRPQFGNLRAGHVTQPLINAYAKRRQLQRRSNSTIVSDLLILRAACNWAVKSKVEGAEKVVFEMPVRRSKPRERWLTKDEGKRLEEACIAPHLRLFVIIGLTTAARMEAILTLKWEQVDFVGNRIDFGEGDGNKRRAVVPINKKLRAALLDAHGAATCKRVIEFGGHHVTDIRTGLHAACRRAGIERIGAHVLRHTAISWMVQSGIPTARIARYAGTTEKMVSDVYGKHDPEYLHDAAAALEF